MTEILMMTQTPQLQKIAIKKRASHPYSKANHHSKNDVIVVDDTNTALLNADKTTR